MSVQVFLGGSCHPTTWRSDVAIPRLEKAGITFYNPQVPEWKPELAALEAKKKAQAQVLLFVIDRQTRALSSILEATESICTGRRIFLVVQDIEDGTMIEDQKVTGRELKDVNRARAYLRELAQRYNVNIYDTVENAIAALIHSLSGGR